MARMDDGEIAGWVTGVVFVGLVIWGVIWFRMARAESQARMHANADCIDILLSGHKPLQKIAIGQRMQGRVGLFSSYFVVDDKVKFSFLAGGKYYMGYVALGDVSVQVDNKIDRPYIDIYAEGHRSGWAAKCHDVNDIFYRHVKRVTVYCNEKDFPRQINMEL